MENVLRPLNERRVEALLLDEQFRAPGRLCSECGWLGPEGEEACPAHGAPLQRVDDVTEPAIEAAVRQDARVLPMRHRRDALQARGGIAALLRF